MMEKMYNLKKKLKIHFLKKKNYLFLSMWKLTLDYGTILETSTLVNNGLAYQGKDIVLRFTIGYNSLRDFGP
jgi:hypothetical protein